ncbi:MAG TPA: AMP-binding protein [Solirubrobacteraceae bacterium]|jgi:O-succinylbenzoic acid--CoA ligase|nr:AMP-binding protein [Solirubrobacteraceae bacterium]
MHDWLRAAARYHPRRVALEFADRRELSYAELLQAATSRASVDDSQVGPRYIEGGDDFAIELHAALLNGTPAVPLDPRLTAEERALRIVAGELPYPGIATVMFTSGTTAAPKPVHLTLRNWEANAVGSALALGLDQNERWLCVMPLAHVGGLSILMRSTLYATTVVLHERFDTEAVLEQLMNPEREITLVSLVPTMLARLLDAGLERPPSLRWALLGGGPIARPLLERAQRAGVPVAPSYGMTEGCSQIATFGIPLHGVQMRLDDGEVVVTGPNFARNTLDADGWLRTGDLGTHDRQGRLEIIGRRSETIVSGGENVAPAEVESVLLEHPAVADAGVFGRRDDEWGERVVATVVLRDGQAVSPAELREFAAGRLARFKVPKEIGFAEALPRTASGKLLRRELA